MPAGIPFGLLGKTSRKLLRLQCLPRRGWRGAARGGSRGRIPETQFRALGPGPGGARPRRKPEPPAARVENAGRGGSGRGSAADGALQASRIGAVERENPLIFSVAAPAVPLLLPL